ncbi:extracellular solute-binding protein [Leptolyngbya cf. ectocarpi LEGE 11479]|uniref:Extracellular solute-binding protein n=1 Tax=Leptolyngbya cf. ectocarpi LEGE 11479 TaxID=1828722 RepID=A0A928X2C9_LEPEC|nr:extracellular solute-binding protein [Leptolyngbya ectocarpi]MBE9066289.1 extracellular solute-binding protein [Leptolyngbya cf. ectocarpi LEGE 11479]
MVKRRTVLWGLVGTAIASCRPSPATALQIKLLARSVPSQILKAFARKTPTQFEAELTLVEIYQQLQWWRSQTTAPPPLWRRWFSPQTPQTAEKTAAPTVDTSLVTLSDPWLDHAIRQDLIQPLPEFAPIAQLPEPWQRLLRRDQQGKPTAKGELWAVPYRTQGLMIAYQTSMFKPSAQAIGKWGDLWRPELEGRIAMPNQPRLAVAIVLKALGHSINDEAALTRDDVKEQLLALYRQVRVFDSQDYLKALVNEDVWLAVGWSGDILATLVRYRRLGALHPQEGTVLTSDLWVSPRNSSITPATQDWMDFCWQTPIATQISVSSYGLSPLFFLPGANIPESLPEQMLRLPDGGEVLLPLTSSGQTALAELLSASVHE